MCVLMGQKERERNRALWNVLEFGGSGGEKRGKKKKKRVRVHVWREKKDGGKKKGNMDEKKNKRNKGKIK